MANDGKLQALFSRQLGNSKARGRMLKCRKMEDLRETEWNEVCAWPYKIREGERERERARERETDGILPSSRIGLC